MPEVFDLKNTEFARRLADSRVPNYIEPSFVAEQLSGSESTERISYERLLSFLTSEDCRTWFVVGQGGSGKTTLTHHLAYDLVNAGHALLRITSRNLSSLLPGKLPDINGFARITKPADIREKQWTQLVKSRRFIFLVDGLNEIERAHGTTPRWSLVQQILTGGHPFSVVATSRRDFLENQGDVDFALRTMTELSLLPLEQSQVSDYIESRGLDPQKTTEEIRAAGLDGAGSNPFLLKLIADFLCCQQPGATSALPRSRAGLIIETTKMHAGHLTEEEKQVGLRGLTLEAVFCASSLLAWTQQADVKTAALQDLLFKVWPDQPAIDKMTRAFLDTQMVEELPGDYAFRFVHDSITELGVAFAFKNLPEPPKFVWEPSYSSQILADWIGLQPDPDSTVMNLIDRTVRYRRQDLLVDVAIANQYWLTSTTRNLLWRAVGAGLIASRNTMDRISGALVGLPRHMLARAARSGLLYQISKQDAALAAELERHVENGTFNTTTVGKTRRELRRKSGSNSEGNRKEKQDHKTKVLSIPHKDISAWTTQLQNDPEAWRRGFAANALGQIGDRLAVPALTVALDSQKESEGSVRGSAANALGQIGDRLAVPALAAALDPRKESEGRVRGSAANALGQIGDRQVVSTIATALDPQKEDNPIVRGSAANALGQIGDRQAVSVLAAALDPQNESEGKVRGSAAKALGQIGDRTAVPALAAALDPQKESEGKVRGSAANALG